MFIEHISGEARSGAASRFQAHFDATARGNVDDGVAALFYAWEKLHEQGGIRAWSSVLWIPGMKVKDGGARFRGSDGLLSDRTRRDGKSIRHCRGVNRTCHRAGDDDFIGRLPGCHAVLPQTGKTAHFPPETRQSSVLRFRCSSTLRRVADC
jgi:hypothetical protein